MATVTIVEEITQKWTLNDIVTKRVPLGWEKVFTNCLPEFEDLELDIKRKCEGGDLFYPLKKNIFRAFDLCPLNEVKVCIIGQDPYHQTITNGKGERMPRAQGLSFSVAKGDDIPISLQNIYKELEATVEGFKYPGHGDLTKWALQGCLMLNTSLTVNPGLANSHIGIWNGFISKVLDAINEIRPGTVFILWGKEAQKLSDMIGQQCIKIVGPHPSGLSAYKYGFFGKDYFNRANKYLISQGKTPIDWKLD